MSNTNINQTIVPPIIHGVKFGHNMQRVMAEALLANSVVIGGIKYLEIPTEMLTLEPMYQRVDRGHGAYGSALLDPATGRLIAFLVSEHNDLQLALETLRQSDSHPCCNGAIYHSDQGVVYLSGTFQQEVSNQGFVQSVSGRGNSQDNAPMESFFGRMKCEMLNLIALCPKAETAKCMVAGYIDAYNNEHYQYALAGLTPSEYYAYITTGIYPMDNYYGIKATELMPIGALVTARLNAAAAKNKKARAAHARKKEAVQKIMKNPTMVVARDQRVLQREISKWTRSKKTAMLQVTHLKEVLEKVKQAQNYLLSAPAKLLKELSCGQSWSKYPELAYIYDMRELF